VQNLGTKLIDIADEWVWGSEGWLNINGFSFFRGSPAVGGYTAHYWSTRRIGARALPVRSGN